jgi:hypothetical protein
MPINRVQANAKVASHAPGEPLDEFRKRATVGVPGEHPLRAIKHSVIRALGAD